MTKGVPCISADWTGRGDCAVLPPATMAVLQGPNISLSKTQECACIPQGSRLCTALQGIANANSDEHTPHSR